MGFITGLPTIGEIDLYSTSTINPGPFGIGQMVQGGQGKFYRYGLVDPSTALIMGNMLQGSVVDTTYTNMTVATAITAAQVTAGTNQIAITNGTATITSQQFEGGSLSIYTAGTVAIGDEYTILSVTGTLTTGGALTVTVDRNFRTAITTSAKVNMRRSPFSGLLQSATTVTASCAGTALTAAAVATYTFTQTHGVGAALSDGSSILVGSALAVPSATAGAVILAAAGLAPVGQAMQAAASAHAIGVFFQVD